MSETADDHTDDPQDQAKGPLPQVSPRTQQCLQGVADALQREAGQEAIRLLMEGIAQGVFPSADHIAPRLLDAMGKAMTGRLVKAFAAQPCYYCKEGLLVCEECDGKGRLDEGQICGGCIGLGQAPCGFCNGSGYMTISTVPKELRLAVVRVRVGRTAGQLAELLEQAMPTASPEDLPGAVTACARLLADLDRAMGVMENAVIAVKGMAPTDPKAQSEVAEIGKVCAHSAAKLHDRMVQAVQRLAEVARLRESRASDEAERMAASQQAAYYDLLVTEDLARTVLEHSLVRQLA